MLINILIYDILGDATIKMSFYIYLYIFVYVATCGHCNCQLVNSNR